MFQWFSPVFSRRCRPVVVIISSHTRSKAYVDSCRFFHARGSSRTGNVSAPPLDLFSFTAEQRFVSIAACRSKGVLPCHQHVNLVVPAASVTGREHVQIIETASLCIGEQEVPGTASQKAGMGW